MLVKRDPFAREEIYRKREYGIGGNKCTWCGRVNRTPKGKPFLFRYTLETDGGRKFDITGLFCSEQCRKDYQG
jgi:hypothetical protein